MNITSALTSVGAVSGIAYGVSKQKSFWATAGLAVLFAFVGAAIATAYNSFQTKN